MFLPGKEDHRNPWDFYIFCSPCFSENSRQASERALRYSGILPRFSYINKNIVVAAVKTAYPLNFSLGELQEVLKAVNRKNIELHKGAPGAIGDYEPNRDQAYDGECNQTFETIDHAHNGDR